MPATLFLSALALSAVATAQAVVASDAENIVEAYNNFRSNESLMFEMKGTETNGGIKTDVYAVLYWKRAVDPRTGLESSVKVELDLYDMTPKVPRVTMRIVGDGLNLYRYDLVRKEVSTTTYGLYGSDVKTVTKGYTDGTKLIAQLRAATPGLAAYLVRLVAQINPSGGDTFARFADWIPGSQGLPFDAVPIPTRHVNPTFDQASFVVDPLTGRPFVKGDPAGQQYAFAGYDGRPTDRTVAFTLYDANYDASHESSLPPKWLVQAVNVALASRNRLVDLTLIPSTNTDLPAGIFVPYTGAAAGWFRPVTASNH